MDDEVMKIVALITALTQLVTAIVTLISKATGEPRKPKGNRKRKG